MKKKASIDDVTLAARMKGKQDLSKIKCFRCGEMGHFSTRCPMKKKTGDDEKKKGKQVVEIATFVEIEALTKRLEDFDLISHFL